MKALAIARQSLVRSFRSSFLIGMMFLEPLMLTGFAFITAAMKRPPLRT